MGSPIRNGRTFLFYPRSMYCLMLIACLRQSFMSRKWTRGGQNRMNLFPITLLNTYMGTLKKNNKRTPKRARIIGTLLPVIPMWFVITIVSFLAIGCVKESEIDKMIAESPIPEKDPLLWKSMIIKSLGIDKPFHIHYFCWMGLMKQEDGQYHGVLQGNLGDSLWY
jgi:hypothetical protein